MWDFKTHLSSPTRLAVYLTYNPLYAREALRKQDMRFGLRRETIHPKQPGPLHRVGVPD
jgi:hypothetical protein